MTRVSRKKLDKRSASSIRKRFARTLASLRTEEKSGLFVDELLTSAEQVMFAKRLAALLMIARGITAYKVQMLLRMSPDTTNRLAVGIKRNKYPHIVSFAKRAESKKQFWDDVEVLLRCGMPERGRGRWKWLDELYDGR